MDCLQRQDYRYGTSHSRDYHFPHQSIQERQGPGLRSSQRRGSSYPPSKHLGQRNATVLCHVRRRHRLCSSLRNCGAIVVSQKHRRLLYEITIPRRTSYKRVGCFGMLWELDDRQRDPKKKTYGTIWEIQAKKASR